MFFAFFVFILFIFATAYIFRLVIWLSNKVDTFFFSINTN